MLVIFDLDGVLVKASWNKLFEAYKNLIAADGKDWKDFFIDISEFKKFWSPDWNENNKKLRLKNVDVCHQIFYETYDGIDAGLFSWAPKIISQISKKHQLAICTNRHGEKAKILIKPISKYFSCVIGGENVKRLKPNPEGICMILDILKIKTKDVLMIGDMPADIIAGRAAGIKTGVVKWGLGDWDELMTYSPDYAFKKHEHLLKI
ncbi:MAG: hypothetical protein A3A10_01850 [Candidatus Tagabacteria bacterium RIFCSPLOWO2_01_FULL_42_9]|uniref:HAD family hydrolase n=1 Tax=Candidatus Tagabacteria bacterium RIFCSPLOWO2_01_FULL_42_9 TaxID=1802296 RepID=A0A1G2LWS8_9BACT|nr:MAG: hypothetical protein A3A10_01850 [Candidatus Tagabacteria bacterium RIFCSPLOWO2_01_FULL_42_9]